MNLLLILTPIKSILEVGPNCIQFARFWFAVLRRNIEAKRDDIEQRLNTILADESEL